MLGAGSPRRQVGPAVLDPSAAPSWREEERDGFPRPARTRQRLEPWHVAPDVPARDLALVPAERPRPGQVSQRARLWPEPDVLLCGEHALSWRPAVARLARPFQPARSHRDLRPDRRQLYADRLEPDERSVEVGDAGRGLVPLRRRDGAAPDRRPPPEVLVHRVLPGDGLGGPGVL